MISGTFHQVVAIIGHCLTWATYENHRTYPLLSETMVINVIIATLAWVPPLIGCRYRSIPPFADHGLFYTPPNFLDGCHKYKWCPNTNWWLPH